MTESHKTQNAPQNRIIPYIGSKVDWTRPHKAKRNKFSHLADKMQYKLSEKAKEERQIESVKILQKSQNVLILDVCRITKPINKINNSIDLT